MNMLALSLLLLPLAAAFVLLYSPAVQALNPGNEVMTASNYTFQSDTFSVAGAIGSLAGDRSDPSIITGQWILDVQGGSVAGFSANLTMVNASGTGSSTIQLSNLSSSDVTTSDNGTTLVTGVLDVTVHGTEKLSGMNATIWIAQLRALNMTLSGPDYLDEPIYGTADQPQQTSTASTGLMPEGSGMFGNITEKFRLPELPNPFK